MPKIGVITIVSFILNLVLAGWLVSQYYNDIYFHDYVNASIGPYYAFIVLSIGVGGGSGLGYLFLKKRHSDSSLVSKIQKSKSFRPVQPLSSPTSIASPRSVLPAGAPPAPTSKHTVYAVPPLPKNPSPGGSKTVPSTTWSASSKASIEPFPVQKQETTVRQLIGGQQSSRTEPSRPASSPFSPNPQSQPSPPFRSIGETSRPPPSWTPTPSAVESRSESGPVFQKPSMDIGAKQEPSFSRIPSSPQIPESSPVPSKWAPPPDTKPPTGQFSGTGVRSIPPLPPKWTPPSGAPIPQDRPTSPPTIPRPGQIPPRGPLPPQQGAPRPFVPPGLGRPGSPAPIGPPRPFRPPDSNRPPPSMSPQPRPPQPAIRPAPNPIGGPMPQPWTPASEPLEKKDSSGNELENTLGRQSSEPKPSPEPATGGGGEMDWDTALDTILKTLRKDRVGDTK